jgi:hypothetical protein
MLASGSALSATIRAFSSSLQSRRRRPPVITSTSRHHAWLDAWNLRPPANRTRRVSLIARKNARWGDRSASRRLAKLRAHRPRQRA